MYYTQECSEILYAPPRLFASLGLYVGILRHTQDWCAACPDMNLDAYTCTLAILAYVTIVFKGVREYAVFQNCLCGGKKIKILGSVSV